MATKKKLLQAAAGNAGGGAGLDVEEVFSTFLYSGNGSTRTITNGIDLDGEGGLVWIKNRGNTTTHNLHDTERGAGTYLQTNASSAEVTDNDEVTAFNSNGFSLGDGTKSNSLDGSDYASWTFRKAPKFFDVVTYTGNGVAGRTVSHNLNSVPGCIIVKATNNARSWAVYHRGTDSTAPEDYGLYLNETTDRSDDAQLWNDTAPTSTEFTVGTDGDTNVSGRTYVAYIFAHNDGDGEFGPDGDADIIKCGSFTDNGSLTTVNLGFEPQWLLVKKTNSSGPWELLDNMRGLPANQSVRTPLLYANDSAAESYSYKQATSDSSGFTWKSGLLSTTGDTLIYVAIRARDGNVVAEPETATDAFDVSVSSGSTGTAVSTGFPVDMQIQSKRSAPLSVVLSRKQNLISITGTAAANAGLTMRYLQTASTSGSLTNEEGQFGQLYNNTGFSIGSSYSGASTAYYSFKRARGFFDVVAYTGDSPGGVGVQTISHNLGVAPEMIWFKRRDSTGGWGVLNTHLPLSSGLGQGGYINETSAFAAAGWWGSPYVAPTSTEFTVRGSTPNASGGTYIAYLFASLAGISKVGSVTHSGTTNVDCGFTSGARFVLLKRTDATGDWYVWDSVRGIVSGNDPYLLLNTTGAEVTNTDYIDPLSSGFTITDDFTDGDYIFYAIA